MHRNKKKGITLTEICVALAVLSIISLVVVSFAAMATGRGATGTDKLKFMQDIELLEATVDDWFEAVYTDTGSVTIDSENPQLLRGGEKTLSWSGTSLYATFSEEAAQRSYYFEAITGVKFTKEASGSDEIFFCTVTYVYRQGQNKEVEKTYTFCVNPRVGESVS